MENFVIYAEALAIIIGIFSFMWLVILITIAIYQEFYRVKWKLKQFKCVLNQHEYKIEEQYTANKEHDTKEENFKLSTSQKKLVQICKCCGKTEDIKSNSQKPREIRIDLTKKRKSEFKSRQRQRPSMEMSYPIGDHPALLSSNEMSTLTDLFLTTHRVTRR